MKGIIVKWDDEKGYGFIRIDGSKQEIFCHISDFSQRSPRPELNEAVGFEVSANGKGKNVAKQIRYLNREARDFKRNHNHRSSAKKKSFFALDSSSSILTKLVGLALFGLIGYQIYQFAAAKLVPKQTNAPVELNDPATIQAKKAIVINIVVMAGNIVLRWCHAKRPNGFYRIVLIPKWMVMAMGFHVKINAVDGDNFSKVD